jgi:hypothetical protein
MFKEIGDVLQRFVNFECKKYATGLNAGSENFIESILFGHGL